MGTDASASLFSSELPPASPCSPDPASALSSDPPARVGARAGLAVGPVVPEVHPVDEVGGGVAGQELVAAQHRAEEVTVGDHAAEPGAVER